MKKLIIRILCISLFLFTLNTVFGQSLSNILSTQKEYTSIDEANIEPEKVLRLNLSNLNLENANINFSKFVNLQSLILRNDHLTKLPLGISELKNLKMLDVGANLIDVLPEDFLNLIKLEELFLDEDINLKLKEDIEILGRMPNLKSLHLNNNGMQKLPENFVKLKKLQYLYLNDNQLDTFPNELKKLKQLKYLDIRHNPMPGPINYLHPAGSLSIKF